jgi:hypothetical protein
VAGEEAEERVPHRLAQRARRDADAARLGRLDAHQQHRQVEAGEEDGDGRPAEPAGQGDGEAAGELHAGAVEHVPRADGDGLLVGAQHVDRVGVDGDVLRGAREGDRERQREQHPRRVG